MQIIEEEDSLDFDSSRRSKNESFPQSASLHQPTPPKLNQSPIPKPKEQSDLIIPPSKQVYHSRNTYIDSMTDPGIDFNNKLIASQDDDSRKQKA